MKAIQQLVLALAIGTTLFTGFASNAQAQTVQSVPAVDLKQYSGTWYEIASFPSFFQREDCVGTSATYTLNTDGSIKVWNQCYYPGNQGGWKLDRIEGRATVANAPQNSQLKVSFAGPFAGDYWVIDLDDNYQYAVVGTPSRNYLWILSRDPQMDPGTYASLLEKARAQGFDTNRLSRTPSVAESQH